MYTFWRAVSLFCKGLVSLKSCVEQLQFPHEKNISQYMQGSALHKHRTFYIAISPCMNTLDHGEILLTCLLQSRLDAKNPWQFAIRIPLVMYTFWRAVSLFCKGLVSLKSCVEQLQFPHEKGSSSHSECLVQLFCLISCWFIFCWCILLVTPIILNVLFYKIKIIPRPCELNRSEND
jgi:hypothetical protein